MYCTETDFEDELAHVIMASSLRDSCYISCSYRRPWGSLLCFTTRTVGVES